MLKKEDLKIVFMGTPEFAVASLDALVSNGYNVVGVVTQPDKPVGRHGSVLQAPPIKTYAIEHDIPVMQPERLKDDGFVATLEALGANLFVVVAFRMLPEMVWSMPKYGTFNVHAALLPQYRGAAPINWAIINGEKETGVTTFFLDKNIDTSRVIMQKKYAIGDEENVESVYNALMKLGAEICVETVNEIIISNGKPESMPQSEMEDNIPTLHHAPKLFKDNCRISWQWQAKYVHDFIRGLSPVPGAWTVLVTPDNKETVLKIYDSRLAADADIDMPSGTMLRQGKRLLVVAARGQAVEILSLQLAGKKRMDAVNFLNGMKNVEDCTLA